jgi:hypothetical protein
MHECKFAIRCARTVYYYTERPMLGGGYITKEGPTYHIYNLIGTVQYRLCGLAQARPNKKTVL